MRFFFAEATAIGFAGGLLGFAAGMLLSEWVGQRVFAMSITPRLIVLPATLALMMLVCAGWSAAATLAGPRAAGGNSAGRMMAPLVQVDDISKAYSGVVALDHVSFDVQAGEWIAIMGPSGSGKTTLINILGGLDRPTRGPRRRGWRERRKARASVELTRYRAEKIGFVFQQFHLVPYLSAVENVMLAQYFHSMADEAEAAEALVRVGLGDRLHHLPSQLSGGEQQRVALARALINQPKLILADEPTGNLDEANEQIVLDLLQELHRAGTPFCW